MESKKDVNARMDSIKTVQKMTDAMKNIAASELKKARKAFITSNDLVNKANDLIRNVDLLRYAKDSCLEKKKVKIVITSDKGLCGGVNSNLIRAFFPSDGDVLCVGVKGFNILNKTNNVIKKIDFPTKVPCIDIANEVYDYVKNYSSIDVIYSHSNSISDSTPKSIGVGALDIASVEDGNFMDYDLNNVDSLLKFYIVAKIFNALNNAYVSYQSAKFIAMTGASSNAKDLLFDLKFKFNKMRQSSITAELIEIVSANQVVSS